MIKIPYSSDTNDALFVSINNTTDAKHYIRMESSLYLGYVLETICRLSFDPETLKEEVDRMKGEYFHDLADTFSRPVLQALDMDWEDILRINHEVSVEHIEAMWAPGGLFSNKDTEGND